MNTKNLFHFIRWEKRKNRSKILGEKTNKCRIDEKINYNFIEKKTEINIKGKNNQRLRKKRKTSEKIQIQYKKNQLLKKTIGKHQIVEKIIKQLIF